MRSLATMFLWHIELAVLAAVYAAAALLAALATAPPHACAGDIAAAGAIAAAASAALLLQLAVACTPKRAGVADARHADVALALVGVVAVATLGYALRDAPQMSVPCVPLSGAFLLVLNGCAHIAAFTASPLGAVVPMWLTSDALALGGCAVFVLTHKLALEPGASAVVDGLAGGLLTPLLPSAAWLAAAVAPWLAFSGALAPAATEEAAINLYVAGLVLPAAVGLFVAAALAEDILRWLPFVPAPWAAVPRAAALGVAFVFFVFFTAATAVGVVGKTAGSLASGMLALSCVLRLAGIVQVLFGNEQFRPAREDNKED